MSETSSTAPSKFTPGSFVKVNRHYHRMTILDDAMWDGFEYTYMCEATDGTIHPWRIKHSEIADAQPPRNEID